MLKFPSKTEKCSFWYDSLRHAWAAPIPSIQTQQIIGVRQPVRHNPGGQHRATTAASKHHPFLSTALHTHIYTAGLLISHTLTIYIYVHLFSLAPTEHPHAYIHTQWPYNIRIHAQQFKCESNSFALQIALKAARTARMR